MQLRLKLAVMLIASSTSAAVMVQVGQGWVVDVTWQYEAQARRTLGEGRTGPGGADTRLNATGEVRIAAEARGTMEFSGKLRGR